MSKSYIYEPLPEGARPVAAWWAILQVPLLFMLALVGAAVVAALVAIAVFSIAILGGSWDPAASAEPPGWTMGVLIAAAMLGLFISLTFVSIMKIKMEKRSLASAGITGFLYGGKFWGGFGGGILVAIVLGIPAALAGAVFGMPEATEAALNFDHVLSGQFALMVLGIFIFVMIQAPAEEIFIRGWLLSALTWRHGLVVALVFSSIVFSLLHADRVVAGFMWMVYTLIAVGSIGVLFAALSYAARSVLPAAGMHTGYNFTLITLGVGYLLAQSEDGDVFAALAGALDMENLPTFEFTPVTIIDLLSRGAIPLALAFWYFGRRKAAPAVATETTTA
ncbi:CPBP family intramembrane metalloprotease [Parvularcula flava]|uniref:CPBP family intramembrane metalloprotease n=1 Tax=Aquisalinus luteolus TaxID=1566827 RepID=A0A8J3A811_9PROT|nr:type II CAAX endopeptidase family protein [Aquisalinus luteolus]NHK28232.1 CPBP family intramembrane metalloprotease [Aquisalinus luteolus]GGH97861.1 hypothetical protein GCM10011355_20090 [Aquisalinus luteolus]